MLGQPLDPKSREVSSPSRTYVAVCNKTNFNGYYMRKFTLPVEDPTCEIENNCSMAAWWFLNRLNAEACIEGVMPYENYIDIKEQE